MTDADIQRPPSDWIFTSLRGYRMGWLPDDLVAGLPCLMAWPDGVERAPDL